MTCHGFCAAWGRHGGLYLGRRWCCGVGGFCVGGPERGLSRFTQIGSLRARASLTSTTFTGTSFARFTCSGALLALALVVAGGGWALWSFGCPVGPVVGKSELGLQSFARRRACAVVLIARTASIATTSTASTTTFASFRHFAVRCIASLFTWYDRCGHGFG